MILEKDRIALEEKQRGDAVKIYEEEVKVGKSAERLLNNPDWQRISGNITRALEARKASAMESVRAVLSNTDGSTELDLKACTSLRKLFQEIEDWDYILNLPKREMEVGESASQHLAKLRGEGTNAARG